MACRACEQRRVLARIMLEAVKQWSAKPAGPSVMEITKRLREEAVAKGELDAGPV